MYEIAADVVFEVVDGDAVLLNLADGRYYHLNAVGCRIWQLLDAAPMTATALVDVLEREYRAPRAALEADLASLLDDLSEAGLVRSHDADV